MTSSGYIFQLDYDQMSDIRAKFLDSAQDVEAVREAVRRAMKTLETTWQGRGSDAFFAEMTGEVLPALKRLNNAFIEAHNVTAEFCAMVNGMEFEAAALFEQR